MYVESIKAKLELLNDIGADNKGKGSTMKR